MIWFLVALVTFANAPSPDLKIHAGLKFESFQECNDYRASYEQQLTQSLKRKFPKITNSIIRCIDSESVAEMRRYMNNRAN
jgi:hypothetical protein